MNNYYPILKLRSSEMSALNEIKKDFLPIIEVDNNAQEKTLEYLKDYKKPYFLDLKNKDELLDFAKTKTFFPVLGVDKDYYYNFSCIELARKNGKAIIRVKRKDFNRVNEILSLQKATGLKDDNVKILLDLETLPHDIEEIYNEIVSVLPNFENVILAGNSVPNTTASITRNTFKEIERQEWTLYQELKSANSKLYFGDYSVRHHQSIGNESDKPTYFRVDVKLIYSTETGFLVFRGEQANEKGKSGTKSIIPICKQITALEDFNKDYSYGDTKIYEIATQEEAVKTGNSAEWIKIGHTHHITLLCDLLSS